MPSVDHDVKKVENIAHKGVLHQCQGDSTLLGDTQGLLGVRRITSEDYVCRWQLGCGEFGPAEG